MASSSALVAPPSTARERSLLLANKTPFLTYMRHDVFSPTLWWALENDWNEYRRHEGRSYVSRRRHPPSGVDEEVEAPSDLQSFGEHSSAYTVTERRAYWDAWYDKTVEEMLSSVRSGIFMCFVAVPGVHIFATKSCIKGNKNGVRSNSRDPQIARNRTKY